MDLPQFNSALVNQCWAWLEDVEKSLKDSDWLGWEGFILDPRIQRAFDLLQYALSNHSAAARKNDSAALDHIVENVSIDVLLTLISLLVHPFSRVRVKMIDLILKFGSILSNQELKNNREKFGEVASLLRHGKTTQRGVGVLFDHLGESFAPISRSITSHLRPMFVHPDPEIRKTSITIVSTLVHQNVHLYDKQETTNLMWSLFMHFSSPGGNKIKTVEGYSDQQATELRATVLENFSKIAEIAFDDQIGFAKHALGILIKSPDRSLKEKRSKKEALSILAKSLCKAELEVEFFSRFVEVVSSQDSSLVTEIPAIIQDLVSNATQMGRIKLATVQFLQTVEEFFVSPQAELRYGAAVCIHAIVTTFPLSVIKLDKTQLLPLLLSGCLDECQSCAVLCLDCIKAIMTKLASRKKRDTDSSSDERIIPGNVLAWIEKYENAVFSSEGDTKMTHFEIMKHIVSETLPLCKSFEEAICNRFSTGLQFLPKDAVIHRMKVLNLWAGSLNKSIPMLINNLLNGLRSNDPTTGRYAISLFKSLAPALEMELKENKVPDGNPNLYLKSVGAIETVFRQVLESCTDEMVVGIVDAIQELPFDMLKGPALERLLRVLVSKCFSAGALVRIQIYQMIGVCKRFWKTDRLNIYAVCCCLCLLGEATASGMDALLESIDTLTHSDSSYTKLTQCLENYRDSLTSSDFEVRVDGFNEIIQIIPLMRRIKDTFISDEFLFSIVEISGSLKMEDAVAQRKGTKEEMHENIVSKFLENKEMEKWTRKKKSNQSNYSQPIYYIALAQVKLGYLGRSNRRTLECRAWALENLQEMLGFYRTSIRNPTCVTLIHCFHKVNDEVNLEVLRDFILLAFRVVKSVDIKVPLGESVLDVMTRIVPFCVTRLNDLFVIYFLPSVFSLLSRVNLQDGIRLKCIQFIGVLLHTRPKQMQPFLGQVRDNLRESFALIKVEDLDIVSIVYAQVVQCATNNEEDAETYFLYLYADLAPLFEGGDWRESHDPLIAKLGPQQLKASLRSTVSAMGRIQHPSQTAKAIDVLLDLIHNSNVELRAEAVKSIWLLSNKLDAQHSTSIRWVTLPMLADPSEIVRERFHSSLFDQLEKTEGNVLNPDVDDYVLENPGSAVSQLQQLINCTPEELVLEPFFSVDKAWSRMRSIADRKDEEKRRSTGEASQDSDLEIGEREEILSRFDYKEKAQITPKFAQLLRDIANNFGGDFQLEHVDLVKYHIHQFSVVPVVNGAAALILAEIGRNYCDELPQGVLNKASHSIVDLSKEVGLKQDKIVENIHDFLTCLLLNLQETKGETVDMNLILGSSIGLSWMCEVAQGVVVPFLVNNMCSLGRLQLGHLLCLKRVFQVALSTLSAFVPSEKANILTAFLLQQMLAKDVSMDTTRAALDLIGEIALLADSKELSQVVNAIIFILEEKGDASIHAMSQKQLSRVLEMLEGNHPLVLSLIGHVSSGLVSHEPSKRQRSFTLLSIVCKPMGLDRAVPAFVRALADPDLKLKHQASRALLQAPPEYISKDELFVNGIRKIANILELEKSSLEKVKKRASTVSMRLRRRRRSSRVTVSGGGRASISGVVGGHRASQFNSNARESLIASGVSSNKNKGIADDDPLNSAFLKTNAEYKAVLELYQLDSESFIRKQIKPVQANKFMDTDEEQDAATKTVNPIHQGIPDSVYEAVITGDTIPIIHLLLSLKKSVGREILSSIELDVDAAKELATQFLSEAEEDLAEPSGQGYLAEKETELQQLIHGFTVHGTILHACESLPSESLLLIPTFQELIDMCARSAKALRQKISRCLDRAGMISASPLDLPFVSLDQFQQYESQRAHFYSSLSDMDQRIAIDQEREQVKVKLERCNTFLWFVSRLQYISVQCVGALYSSMKQIDKNVAESGFDWLLSHLTTDENMHLRQVSRHAIVDMSRSTKRGHSFKKHVAESLFEMQTKLEANRRSHINSEGLLYRAKVDLMFALAHLIPCSDLSGDIRSSVIKLLVSFWDDPDGYVRQTSIQLIETVGDAETIASMINDPVADEETKPPEAHFDLRIEISKRMNNPVYSDKDSLNRLLQWCYKF
mmetsp:Transcript_28060/g.44984  ORF Transcript_28060/g.44984 Transcript_28060/m.44984 type:complete len:2071 (+) Transcript_28060:1711-7923(+)